MHEQAARVFADELAAARFPRCVRSVPGCMSVSRAQRIRAHPATLTVGSTPRGESWRPISPTSYRH